LEITRFYVGREMDFEINLMCKAREVQPSRLSATSGPRLGWTSWIKTADFTSDDAQVVLNPERIN
jgi:predicted component of type VI protein secretion system